MVYVAFCSLWQNRDRKKLELATMTYSCRMLQLLQGLFLVHKHSSTEWAIEAGRNGGIGRAMTQNQSFSRAISGAQACDTAGIQIWYIHLPIRAKLAIRAANLGERKGIEGHWPETSPYSTTKGEVNRRELQGSLIRGAHRTLYRGESWDKRVTNVNISDLHVSLTPPRGQSLWVQRVNTNHWPGVCLMLGHRLQRWPNIKPALDQYECLLVRGRGRWASVGIPRGGRSLTLNPLRARTINRNSQIY